VRRASRVARTAAAIALVAWLVHASAARAAASNRDSSHALPSGLELLHITPPGQPPLHSIDSTNFGDLRDAFNADTARVRVMLLVSPT